MTEEDARKMLGDVIETCIKVHEPIPSDILYDAAMLGVDIGAIHQRVLEENNDGGSHYNSAEYFGIEED